MSTQNAKMGPFYNPNLDPPKKDCFQDLDEIKRQIDSCQKDIESNYLRVGRLYWKAKEYFGKHGEWLEWLNDNVDMSVCKVQRLMRVARWMDGNEAPAPYLTFTQAYILCRLSQKELEEFWNFINGMEKVKGMRKRELEAKVRDFLKSKNGRSSAVQEPRQAEVHAPTKDDFSNRLDQIKTEISELASLVGDAPDKYGVFTAELCELCQTIILNLAPEDLEKI